MKRVLVTGATGFIGWQTLSPLLGRGFEVHALYRTTPPNDSPPAVTWHEGDLFDRRAVSALLAQLRPSSLLHMAWEATPGHYWTSPANLSWVAASLSLVQAFAETGGQRLVVAGSSAEYDWQGDQLLEELQGPIKPQSLYGKSKNALRELIAAWAPAQGISWAWGRVFNVFGPGEKPNRLIPRVIRSLTDGELLPFDEGAILRDFLHVADAGEAFAALLDSAVTGPVNIAAGEATSIRELVSSVACSLGKEKLVSFGALNSTAQEPKRVIAHIGRLRDEVGWRPPAPLQQRLRETCVWWQDQLRQKAAPKTANPV